MGGVWRSANINQLCVVDGVTKKCRILFDQFPKVSE